MEANENRELLRKKMRKEFLPFCRPSITKEDIQAVVEVLRSGWITTGHKCEKFEEEFRNYISSKGSVAVSSGTAGMHLVLKSLEIGPGDEVITPSMTWVSTINLIVLLGAKPVFIDIERDTLMVSHDLIYPHLSSKTKMIIPVHFAGASVDMEPIQKLAEERGIKVIEDAAHALGTQYKSKRIGSNGTAVFSFHPIKNITSGEGGMITSFDSKLLERIRRLRFHGLGRDAYDRLTQGRTPHAEVLEAGFKYNLPDILATLGLQQLRRLEEYNAKRSELASHYTKRLAEIDEIIPLAIPSYPVKHSWHLYIIRLDIDKAKLDRDEFMEELKKKNIGTGLHFRPAHQHKYYKGKYSPKSLENTEWNAKRICSLPLFPQMTTEDVDGVVEAIKEVLS